MSGQPTFYCTISKEAHTLVRFLLQSSSIGVLVWQDTREFLWLTCSHQREEAGFPAEPLSSQMCFGPDVLCLGFVVILQLQEPHTFEEKMRKVSRSWRVAQWIGRMPIHEGVYGPLPPKCSSSRNPIACSPPILNHKDF